MKSWIIFLCRVQWLAQHDPTNLANHFMATPTPQIYRNLHIIWYTSQNVGRRAAPNPWIHLQDIILVDQKYALVKITHPYFINMGFGIYIDITHRLLTIPCLLYLNHYDFLRVDISF